MEIKIFEAGPLSANNYLLTDGDEAVLIDCSGVKAEIIDALDGKKLKYILLTHGHFDHILGVNEMKEKTGAKVLVNESDVDRMKECSDIMQSFGFGSVETPVADEYLTDGEIIRFGNTEIKVIYTPGHTQGSVCYQVDDKLFSGDTLFKDCFGRCDLPGGDFSKIQTSIKDILFELDENTTVFPGHGEKTTRAYEKKFNEIL